MDSLDDEVQAVKELDTVKMTIFDSLGLASAPLDGSRWVAYYSSGCRRCLVPPTCLLTGPGRLATPTKSC